ncbi:hypothetical protein F3P21_17255 [Paenibacillus glucanolyticus]|nr:hypothetical protein [Paenibacillus glucanolyticus]
MQHEHEHQNNTPWSRFHDAGTRIRCVCAGFVR